MLENNRYLALAIVVVVAVLYGILKAEVFEYDIMYENTSSYTKYARKAVLFVLTIVILFMLTAQVDPGEVQGPDRKKVKRI